jgi:hypothetical protein
MSEDPSSSADVKSVRKARSAFLFYQSDKLSKIRTELGGSAAVSMGDVMTEVRVVVVCVVAVDIHGELFSNFDWEF